MAQPELTREEIEGLQQEAMLSNEGINEGDAVITLTANCLHTLCDMALAHLRSQQAGYVSVPKAEDVRAIAAMFWNGDKDDRHAAKYLHQYATLLSASPPAGGHKTDRLTQQEKENGNDDQGHDHK